MSLADLLNRYVNVDPTNVPPAQAEQHFDEICTECEPGMLGEGVTEAFRSDRTPPFPDMVGQSFERADPAQRAGILNQVLGGLGPMAGAGMVGGLLQQLLGGAFGDANPAGRASGQGVPQLTPEQAQRVDPRQVRDLAAQAEQAQPGIVERLGGFYAQNPALVRKLGGAALALVLANMATRGRR